MVTVLAKDMIIRKRPSARVPATRGSAGASVSTQNVTRGGHGEVAHAGIGETRNIRPPPESHPSRRRNPIRYLTHGPEYRRAASASHALVFVISAGNAGKPQRHGGTEAALRGRGALREQRAYGIV